MPCSKRAGQVIDAAIAGLDVADLVPLDLTTDEDAVAIGVVGVACENVQIEGSAVAAEGKNGLRHQGCGEQQTAKDQSEPSRTVHLRLLVFL
jgi:hypothetical protein